MPQAAELIGLGMPAELAAEVTDGTSGSQAVTGNISFTATGNHIKYKTGTTAGTFTANGATSVVVNTTAASDTMIVVMSLRTVGGTPAGAPYVFAKTNGTSFSVRAVAGDTSVYNWAIIETNAA
ncbi:MAG: hypothetical protein ACK528_01240 [Alphaproteobacteria bacterium]|jgi:hypothetical protein